LAHPKSEILLEERGIEGRLSITILVYEGGKNTTWGRCVTPPTEGPDF